MTFPASATHYHRFLGRIRSEDVQPGDWVGVLGMGGYDRRILPIGAVYTRLTDHELVFVFDWSREGQHPLWPAEIVPDRWCRRVWRPHPRGSHA